MPFYETPPFFWITNVHFPEEATDGEPQFSDDVVLIGIVTISAEWGSSVATWYNTTGEAFAAALKTSRGYGTVRPRDVTASGFTDINGSTDPYADPVFHAFPVLQLIESGAGTTTADIQALDISGRGLGIIGNRSVTFGTITVEALPEDYVNYPVYGAAQAEIVYEPVEIVDFSHYSGGTYTADSVLVRVLFHAEWEQVTE